MRSPGRLLSQVALVSLAPPFCSHMGFATTLSLILLLPVSGQAPQLCGFPLAGWGVPCPWVRPVSVYVGAGLPSQLLARVHRGVAGLRGAGGQGTSLLCTSAAAQSRLP